LAEHRIFVYGTLRTGAAMTSLLRGCRRIGDATVTGALYDLRSYPALVLEGEGRVRGEVWLCPGETLARLDTYEQVEEGLFRRVEVEIEGAPCWTYVAGPLLDEEIAGAPAIASGCWLTR
jgi:gamma-glutamylcyclotransferase (GGCT)/AIG2-like uncharacterized protein YtfP